MACYRLFFLDRNDKITDVIEPYRYADEEAVAAAQSHAAGCKNKPVVD